MAYRNIRLVIFSRRVFFMEKMAIAGYPIPRQKCVETSLNFACDKTVVNSNTNTKIWRVYPKLDCHDSVIKAGLSERYLLEGVD